MLQMNYFTEAKFFRINQEKRYAVLHQRKSNPRQETRSIPFKTKRLMRFATSKNRPPKVMETFS